MPDEQNNHTDSAAGCAETPKPEHRSATGAPEITLLDALNSSAHAGEIGDCDRLLDQLRTKVHETPDNRDALGHLAEGLYLALKECNEELWRERQLVLLQEMRQLLQQYPDDSSVKQFLASTLLNIMTIRHDEYLRYDPEPSFRLQDDALCDLKALVARYPDDASLQKRLCKAFRRAIWFSGMAKHYERCDSLLNAFGNEPTLARYQRRPRYMAESTADLLGWRLHNQDAVSTVILVQRLRTIAEDSSGSRKVLDVCAAAVGKALLLGPPQLGADFFASLLTLRRQLNFEGENKPHEWASHLENVLTGADVVHLALLTRQLKLIGEAGPITVDDWWEPDLHSDPVPIQRIEFDFSVRMASTYLLQKDQYSPAVKTIFAAVIMTTIQKAGRGAFPDEDQSLFFRHFLSSQTPEWDWDLIRHLKFDDDATDYFVENTSKERASRKAISAALNLVFPSLHWHLVNADASRVTEFIAYYHRHLEVLNSEAAQQVIDLTAASIDKAVRTNSLMDVVAAEDFLRSTNWTLHEAFEAAVREFKVGWHLSTPGEELSQDLHLRYPALDWLSGNANLELVPEFVSLYADGQKVTKSLAWSMRLSELILQSFSLLTDESKLTPAIEASAAVFLEAQQGTLASRLAVWLPKTAKPAVELFARHIALRQLSDSREVFAKSFGCFKNGEYGGYIVEYCLNCLFDFPLWTGNQDWGYCNRDGTQLKTFISFFLSLPPLDEHRGPATAHYMMHELVVYSLERAIEMDLTDEAATRAITAFARSHSHRVLAHQQVLVKPFVRRYLDSMTDPLAT